jgi:hypothetical protein
LDASLLNSDRLEDQADSFRFPGTKRYPPFLSVIARIAALFCLVFFSILCHSLFRSLTFWCPSLRRSLSCWSFLEMTSSIPHLQTHKCHHVLSQPVLTRSFQTGLSVCSYSRCLFFLFISIEFLFLSFFFWFFLPLPAHRLRSLCFFRSSERTTLHPIYLIHAH